MAAQTPHRIAYLAVALALGLGLAACGKGGVREKPPEPGDVAVARVDGRTVWASEVKREAVAQGLIARDQAIAPNSDLFRQTLDEVVDRKLLAAEAERRGLDKTPDAQRRLAAARERVLSDTLVEKVVAGAVTDNAVRGLYQEQLKLAKRSEEVRARQIVVPTEADALQMKKLLASGAAFEALAMERSTDAATRFNGGELGYFTFDVMPEAYGAALKTARLGQIVGPFQVENGWAIVKVEDRRLEQPITLQAARPQIVRFLTYDQIRDLLEKLHSRAKIETLVKTDTADASGAPAAAPTAVASPQASSPPAKGPHS